MVENNKAKIPWDFEFQTEIVLVDKEEKTAVVIDEAIPPKEKRNIRE